MPNANTSYFPLHFVAGITSISSVNFVFPFTCLSQTVLTFPVITGVKDIKSLLPTGKFCYLSVDPVSGGAMFA